MYREENVGTGYYGIIMKLREDEKQPENWISRGDFKATQVHK